MIERPHEVVFREVETPVWSRVVEVLASGLVDLGQIVTHRFPAERFEDAFELMADRDGIVGKVLPEHETASGTG